MNYVLPFHRHQCPRCGDASGLLARGDSKATIVSTCCEAVIPKLNDEPSVVIEDDKLICPYGDCGAADEIVELDVATRENELAISDKGVITAHLGASTFESDGFECRQCCRRVSLSDGTEIVHA